MKRKISIFVLPACATCSVFPRPSRQFAGEPGTRRNGGGTLFVRQSDHFRRSS